jgi:hypothetical protein
VHLVGFYNILRIIPCLQTSAICSFYEGNRSLRTPIKAILWLNNNHSSYANYYSPLCNKNWSPSLLPLSRAPWLSMDVPSHAGFLWDKAAVLGKTIWETPYMFISVHSKQRTFLHTHYFLATMFRPPLDPTVPPPSGYQRLFPLGKWYRRLKLTSIYLLR